MNMTPELKAKIDAYTYFELLRMWRFAPVGDERFQGESGAYWAERMKELRNAPGGNELHVSASKMLGWDR